MKFSTADLPKSENYHGKCVSCQYLDADQKSWKGHGCSVESVDEEGVTCNCNHTTNFAAFMSPWQPTYQQTDEQKKVFARNMIFNSYTFKLLPIKK